jgi:prolyl-tRNA synthetase
MTHSDDDGLVLPPRIAPTQIVILPIIRGDGARVLPYATALCDRLQSLEWRSQPLRVEIDDRDMGGGEKSWEHIKRGIPVRIEVGPRDVDREQAVLSRRDSLEKQMLPLDELIVDVPGILEAMQSSLLRRAREMREAGARTITSLDEFRAFFTAANGLARTHFCGDGELEHALKEELGVSTRCIPLATERALGPCFAHPGHSGPMTLWARAY